MIVNPHNYDAEAAAEEATDLVYHFCEINELPKPRVRKDNPFTANRGYYSMNRLKTGDGDHKKWQGELFYNPRRCMVPVKTPGYCWSFTGYKADNTAPGVIAHECGHHVWYCLIADSDPKRRQYNRKVLFDCWKAIRSAEAGITSYGDTCTEEDWAETLKLFILNPTLLQEGRPIRYGYLLSCGLKPVIGDHWTVIMQHAHPTLISAARGWIAKGAARIKVGGAR